VEQPWLRFEIQSQGYALPLGAIVEVMPAPRPHLIPRVPLGRGGVVNLRGEPLPAIDGSALLTGKPARDHRHMLVLERGSLRLGVLVGHVSKIENDLERLRSQEEEASSDELVTWVTQDGRALGLVDPDGLIERGVLLLTDGRTKGGQESWHTGF
jgi:chemotaxis signal transduction protein